MKKMRKVLALLLIAAMAMSLLCVGVFADSSVDVSTHTFEAYQIFSGSQATDGGALGQVQWGNGVNGDALLTAIKADATIGADFTDCTTAAQVAEKLATYGSDSDKAKAFARLADANKTTTTTSMTKNDDGTYTMSTKGYYLIVDTTNVAGKQDAKNLSLLAVSTTATITSKTSVPTVVKKVQDKNDTTGETSGLQDTADYDIGDEIPYTITATMGDLTNYKTYYVQFNDTMTHLTYVNGSVKVTVNGVDKTTAFATTWDATTKKLTVICADVIAQGAVSNCDIVVTYNATLDNEANIGAAGNPNTVDLEYSNNPNKSGNGTDKPETGKTPEDKNVVFTYKLDVTKYDDQNDKLEGAGFTLYKLVGGTYTKVGNEIKGEALTTFEWKGVDDGQYKLVETTVPAGYNKMDDQEFTITAKHANDPDALEITELSGNKETGSVITLTADKDAGSLASDIVNKKGSVLPTTGGMGTTLFYVFGAILVLGAGVLLVTKKRMAHE